MGDRREKGGRREPERRLGARRRAFSPREILRLILASYRESLPYLLIFIAGLLLATWLLTELVF